MVEILEYLFNNINNQIRILYGFESPRKRININDLDLTDETQFYEEMFGRCKIDEVVNQEEEEELKQNIHWCKRSKRTENQEMRCEIESREEIEYI